MGHRPLAESPFSSGTPRTPSGFELERHEPIASPNDGNSARRAVRARFTVSRIRSDRVDGGTMPEAVVTHEGGGRAFRAKGRISGARALGRPILRIAVGRKRRDRRRPHPSALAFGHRRSRS